MRARITALSEQRIEVKIGARAEPIYWEVPAEMPISLPPSKRADFLALAAFPYAMRAGKDLELKGKVDRELARNLAQFSIAWCQFKPTVFKRPVRIIAAGYKDRRKTTAPGTGFACAYSGGIDSTYVISRSRSEEHASKQEHAPVSLAVMINGFGFNLESPEDFERSREAGARFCAKHGVSFTTVKTNWAKCLGAYQIFHAIGIATVLHLRSEKTSGGYIGMDFTFDEEFELGPWGNSALMSRLFSASNFPLVSTGGEVSRVQKLRELHLHGDDAHLTVCNTGRKTNRNCGVCEKCFRTMLAYRSFGATPPEGLFEYPLTLEGMRELKITKMTHWVFYNRMVDTWSDKNDPYLKIVREMISDARKRGFSLHKERGLPSGNEASSWLSPWRAINRLFSSTPLLAWLFPAS